MKYTSLKKESKCIQHLGVFKKELPLYQAVALIVSGTIGAGVLGIPYAVAQVGLLPGIFYIIVLGLLMMGLNLMLGSIAVRTKKSMQLSGLARKYIGRWGEILMTVIFYSMLLGVLLIYIIGEGEALAAILGGMPLFWSMVFFVIATIFLFSGMKTIKTVELVLTLIILVVVLYIAAWGAPHVEASNFSYINFAALFFPYGVVLFAFHGTNTIPEAHTLLEDRSVTFKHAIIFSGLISMLVYILFAIIVVGITGQGTTEIASIGLGNAVGKNMILFGNIFAVVAMGTSYLMTGLALSDSLHWDYKVPRYLSRLLVSFIPLILFALGVRQFIAVIDFVGGVFVSLEMLLILLIFWNAKQKGDLPLGKYRLHHTTWLLIVLLITLSIGAVYSVAQLF
jgi:tyrosine-specific transport protein